MKQDFRFFSRLGEKEIDFISATSKEVVPIEVKYQENIKEKDTGWMLNFIEKYTLKKGLIITKSIEQTTVKGRVKIEFIPLWKWLLDG